MTVKSIVLNEIETVARQQKKVLPQLHEAVTLEQTGLDSLCMAILVARLEDKFGRDPFSAEGDVAFPVTIGDFIALYEHDAS